MPGFKKGRVDLRGTGCDTHREGAQRTFKSVSGSLAFSSVGRFILYIHEGHSLDISSENNNDETNIII